MTSENGNGLFNMPVMPAYGGFGNGGGQFGGDGAWWVILLILLCGNGMWGGFGGGMLPMMMGGMGQDYLYPWLNNSQNINNGFRDQMLGTQINGIQNAITSGFGDVQNTLCGGFAGVTASVNGAQNALAQQMYTNQIADLERSFAAQTATTQGFTGVNGGLADIKYAVATENCADRNQAMMNTRDIIEAVNANGQKIQDKLCQLELDGVKQNYENRIAGMQNVINGLNAQVNASDRRVAMSEEIDAQYNRLNNCPVPSMPVYGRTPIFTCNGQNPGCGCGNNVFAN